MDFKPKYLINLVLPLFMLLIATLVYIGYSDYKTIRDSAYSQARANISVAQEYLNQHYTAANNQLYLLSEILQDEEDIPTFLTAAQYVVDHQNKFQEVGLLIDSTYYGTNQLKLEEIADKVRRRPWYDKAQQSGVTFLSPFYRSNSTKKWCVALTRTLEIPGKEDVRIVIELDASAMSQDLSGLKTMKDGYVFAVESESGHVVIHPDPSRLGTASVSLTPTILDEILKGEQAGEIPSYAYQDQYKFSVYETNQRFGWVLLSGTRNQEITANALKLGVVGGTLLALLFFILLVGYLHSRIHQLGGRLLDALEFEDLHRQLSKLLSDTIGCSRVYLFVMNEKEGVLEEPHHQLRAEVPTDLFCRLSGCQQLGRDCQPEQDGIVSQIASSAPCIRLPLVNTARSGHFPSNQLVGILYICKPGLAYRFFVKMIVNYTLNALNQLLLTQHIRSEDQMTGLKNKNYLRKQMEQRLAETQDQYYLAMIDIDDFKSINDTYGHLFGDKVILMIAALMKRSFRANSVLCRYGGEEFAVLMSASDCEVARERLEAFRTSVEGQKIRVADKSCSITVSIGFALLEEGMESTISQADKALYRVKSQGKNQVFYAEHQSTESSSGMCGKTHSVNRAKLKHKQPFSEIRQSKTLTRIDD
ncbi:sensor domain-containing diguanylate cyclase [Photobacterium sp. CCB-ST2H9]|uniref:sensor domain-containing diguanylate cyclase n=1 Tax=Photobacterium sp. CCB-ST2H9 TaxID=2912855 RepID=UPI002004FBE7|nr:sensor domain-containing diguanylate cyclase [Photobacterium sp. CCB-ST2H9]UTM58426.1 sensor domain-containing diguanylate cyclase [Photobacterium sp. CCB-ST2H9]